MNKVKRQTRDQKIYYLVNNMGMSQREVGRAYKLSQTAVWKIVRKEQGKERHAA